jgi:glycosyltransferase involved in cell wall biosynthesis
MSDRILVLTKNNVAHLIRHRMSTVDKIMLMSNGIPLAISEQPSRSSIRKKLSISSDSKVVLSAARLSPEKNLAFILEVARRIEIPNVLFLIAGDGPLRTELEQRIDREGLGNLVRLIGFYPDVRELLSIADEIVQPTLVKRHSIAMLEAMSMGVPSLVSRGVGCNDDFVSDRQNGYLLDPNDAESWAKTIRNLLIDTDTAAKVGRAGRELVEERCDIRDTAETMTRLYRELLDSKS